MFYITKTSSCNNNKCISCAENNLFYYDLNNNEIISINIENKIEKCFEFNNNNNNNIEIKNFDFDLINKKYFYIQNSDKEIIIYNNNNIKNNN